MSDDAAFDRVALALVAFAELPNPSRDGISRQPMTVMDLSGAPKQRTVGSSTAEVASPPAPWCGP
ncbi:hypothetical protein [Streptomyces sp. NBC_00459]|uniref:hypothetical protein n=1 Tax=Streptomyces sp. NBC_00459 TaxID=2975749 RepID=UPI002E19F365